MTGLEVFRKLANCVYGKDEEGFITLIDSLTDEERNEYEAYIGGILNLINREK